MRLLLSNTISSALAGLHTPRVVVVGELARPLRAARRPSPILTTTLSPHTRTVGRRRCARRSRRRARPRSCRACNETSRSGSTCRRAATTAALDVLDELDELGADLLGDELVTLGVGVHAIAFEHVVSEAVRARAVGDGDGGLRGCLLLDPAWDGAVDGLDCDVGPACRDELVDLHDLSA